MKILHITPRLHIGGAEIFVKDLAILARNAGHLVTILTFAKADNHIVDEVIKNKINLIQLPHRSPYSPFSLMFFLTHISEQSYDIIHTHMPLRQKFIAMINSIQSGKLPLITTEHVDTYNIKKKKALHRWAYKQYKKVISCSHTMQNEILLQIPDLHSRCKVIHNGVDYKQLSQLKSDSSTRTSNNTLQVMTVARLDKQKDLATCIRAFAHVKSDIHLSIIGDGPQRKLLTDLIKQLNLSDRITLLGWQSNIPSCLSRADIYVQSSVWEGFSIGVLEAMAMGLPMVVSNAGALVEAVNNAGLIFPVGDAELLAQHLDSLAQNPGLRTEMSQQSLSRVKQFSLDNMWQQYDNVYRDIIKPAMHRSASF